MLSETMRYNKKFAVVNGKRIAYVEEGEGDPIVLIHGNPTSSFLWRNVIPELEGLGRVIASDLIGQGDSEKLPVDEGPDRYSFLAAYEYLDGLLSQLGANRRVALVVHDWGSGLGFHWGMNHPDALKGIAYMEAIVAPLTWEDWPENARGIFQGFRSEKGEDLILNRNMFVEAVLPGAVLRKLTEAEMEAYRRPFRNPEDRRVTLNWPRQIPIDGKPAHMAALVEEYGAFMAGNRNLPKLFVNAEPGSILTGRQREYCRTWPNQREVTVKGVHFLQEDSPAEIGRAVAAWLRGL